MKTYGFMIVKNEADILTQTIEALCKYGSFEKIFIYDNGSTDDTLKIAKKFSSEKIVVNEISNEFSDNLKFENIYHHKDILKEGDWFAILDADEIYQENLQPLIDAAESEGANYIESKSAQFYFTEIEENYDFDPNIPAFTQHPFYLVNYGEPRIFKYSTKSILTSDLVKKRHGSLYPCSRKILIHHVQFRSSKQVQKRLEIRLKNNSHSKNWGHINSKYWQKYIVPAEFLHRFDGTIKTGLPCGANLFKIKDNPAYTMANLNWLRKNNDLTESQLSFFTATRFQKIIRKFF